MANYSDIRGYRVKYLSSDPTLNSSTEGQVWYNSTSGTLKALVKLKAWVSGAPLTTSRFQGGMVGTQTSALIVGSENPGGDIGTVEQYNGSGWSSSPSINTTRQAIGATGTTSAAIAMGGLIAGPNVRQTLSEEWNGTAWTAGNALSEAGRSNISGAATQTASVAMFSGELIPDSNSGKYHEQYDGTSWTASTKCPTVRVQGSYAGDQTAGIGFGGRANSPGAPSVRNKTSDIWNGTTWTSGPSGITARSGHSSHGTDSSAIFARGLTNPGSTYLTSTEEYDGTAFSATPSVTNTGQGIEGGHAQPSPVGAAWIAGGNTVQTATEEYNVSINTVTPGAWASGGNMNTARTSPATSVLGTQTALSMFGGYNGPPAPTGNLAVTENYDGSTWTNSGNLGTARRALSGHGTLTSSLAVGGYNESAGNKQNKTEEYDGSTWTAGNNMTNARYTHAGGGSQTASWVAGDAPAITTTEEYDGTSWTAGGNLNNARDSTKGTGTLTAGLIAGAQPDTEAAKTEHYDGTSWSNANNFNTARRNNDLFGLQTAALLVAGIGTPGTTNIANTEEYNGTNWVTQASISTARQTSRGAGSITAGITAGGGTPSVSNATEEFTGEIETATASTLTTS